MLQYSFLLCPLKSWLFCAQYFESLSLIVDFKWKEATNKITRILTPVVSVLIALLYFTYAGIVAKYSILLAQHYNPFNRVDPDTLDFWDNLSNKFYYATVWFGVSVNFAAIALMLTAIFLVRRKVMTYNHQNSTTH